MRISNGDLLDAISRGNDPQPPHAFLLPPIASARFVPNYAKRESDNLKCILVRDAARAYKYNRDVLKRKALLLNAAVLAIGLEGLFLVIALVLTR